MKTASDIVTDLGNKAMQERLGVNASAISNAVKKEKFPTAWFKGMQSLADELGLELPDELFAWREPA